MAIVAIFGVFEPEGAFESQPAILATLQTKSAGVDGFIQPLNPSRAAGIAADGIGTLGGSTGGAPVGERQRADHHHDQQSGHPPNVRVEEASGKPVFCAIITLKLRRWRDALDLVLDRALELT